MRSASYLSLFSKHTSSTEIYTLSLHDALPICPAGSGRAAAAARSLAPTLVRCACPVHAGGFVRSRSEEHTSELQSQSNLVCRLLLEKKKVNQDEISVVLVDVLPSQVLEPAADG